MRFNPLITTMLSLALLLSCKEKAVEAGSEREATENSRMITLSPAQFRANDMALGVIEKRAFPEVVTVSGQIDVPPENRAVISAVYGGFVKKTTLLVGDEVRKGQVVAIIENPDFLSLQQEFLEVREQLPFLKSEFERQRTLMDEKITSEKSFLQASSAYKTTLARKAGLEKQLVLLGIDPKILEPDNIQSAIPLYAPISGKVSKVNISTGSYVSKASEMLEIIDPHHLHLELSVFEKDIGKVEKGGRIRFRIPEVSDSIYSGEVYLVGGSIDENRTVQVHGHLTEEPQTPLMVGMFVQAEIEIAAIASEKVRVLYPSLPEGAIRADESGSYMAVLSGKGEMGYTFRKVPIQTGISSNGYTAIIPSGNLNPEDSVLVKGAYFLPEF